MDIRESPGSSGEHEVVVPRPAHQSGAPMDIRESPGSSGEHEVVVPRPANQSGAPMDIRESPGSSGEHEVVVPRPAPHQGQLNHPSYLEILAKQGNSPILSTLMDSLPMRDLISLSHTTSSLHQAVLSYFDKGTRQQEEFDYFSKIVGHAFVSLRATGEATEPDSDGLALEFSKHTKHYDMKLEQVMNLADRPDKWEEFFEGGWTKSYGGDYTFKKENVCRIRGEIFTWASKEPLGESVVMKLDASRSVPLWTRIIHSEMTEIRCPLEELSDKTILVAFSRDDKEAPPESLTLELLKINPADGTTIASARERIGGDLTAVRMKSFASDIHVLDYNYRGAYLSIFDLDLKKISERQKVVEAGLHEHYGGARIVEAYFLGTNLISIVSQLSRRLSIDLYDETTLHLAKACEEYDVTYICRLDDGGVLCEEEISEPVNDDCSLWETRTKLCAFYPVRTLSILRKLLKNREGLREDLWPVIGNW